MFGGGSILAGVEAVLAQLSSIRAASDVRDHLAAFAAFISRAQKLTSFQDELVQDGDIILRGAVRDHSIFTRFFFVVQFGDLLHELEQGRLKFRGFHHGFQRSTVISEPQAGITSLDFLSEWMVAFCNMPQPAFTTAGSTGYWLVRSARVFQSRHPGRFCRSRCTGRYGD